MEFVTVDSPEAQGAGPVAGKLTQIRALLPEAFPDGEVDFEVLRQLLGGAPEAGRETYGLQWQGKRLARQQALSASSGTLRPCPEADESLDWAGTGNLLIEGDNLEVLKLLQEDYSGKVKLIYIDPPYNTGNDFVYSDRFLDYALDDRMQTGPGADGDATPTRGRPHADWLNMIYPRLKLARDLLRPDGLIVVHIDEHEAHSLRMVLQELFGEDNELGMGVWDKRNPKGDARGLAYQHESIAMFARDIDILFRQAPLKRPKRNAQRMLAAAGEAVRSAGSMAAAAAIYAEFVKGAAGLSGGEARYDRLSRDGRVYRLVSMAWPNKKRAPDAYFIPLVHPVTNRPCPVPGRGWRNPPETMADLLARNLIEFGPDETTQPQRRYFLDENRFEKVPSIIPFGGSDDALLEELGIPFEHPKPVALAADLIGWCSAQDDIVLDFFAGSGTTGHAVMLQNARDQGRRRFILVQLPQPLDPAHPGQKTAAAFCRDCHKPQNLAELTKERLRRSAAKFRRENPGSAVDCGFRVFKLDSSRPPRPGRPERRLDLADG